MSCLWPEMLVVQENIDRHLIDYRLVASRLIAVAQIVLLVSDSNWAETDGPRRKYMYFYSTVR